MTPRLLRFQGNAIAAAVLGGLLIGTPVVVAIGDAVACVSASPPLWVADYESGDFSAFASTPNNFAPLAPSVTNSLAAQGTFSAGYSIPAGGQRSENVTLNFTEGDERWFAFSTQLGDSVPLDTSQWQVISQWKSDGSGSPPLQLNIDNGRFEIAGGWGWPGTEESHSPKWDEKDLGAASAGIWDDWLIHVKFSDDPSVGYVEVWRNGSQQVDEWHLPGGTLYPNLDSYLKVGYYRSSSINVDATVYHDDWRVGVSRESVGG